MKSKAAGKAKPTKSASPKTPYSRDRGVLMSAAEAADYLGLTEGMLRALSLRGEIPRIPIGDQLVRYHIDDLDAYIAAQRETVGR